MPKPGAKVDVKAVVEVEVEVSEEEAMNGGDGDGGGEGSGSGPGAPRGKPDSLPAAYDADEWIAYVDGVDTDMDEEEAMNAEFVPREPLVSVLRRMDTVSASAVQVQCNCTVHRAQIRPSSDPGSWPWSP